MDKFLTDLIASAQGIDPFAWLAYALAMILIVALGRTIHQRERAKYDAEERRRLVLARLFLDQQRSISQAIRANHQPDPKRAA